MAGLQKILLILLVLFLIVVVVVFSLNNQVAVPLNLLVFETAPRGVAIWIILAFVVGAVAGILLTLLTTLKQSVSKRHLQKRLDRAEKALEQSRNPADRTI